MTQVTRRGRVAAAVAVLVMAACAVLLARAVTSAIGDGRRGDVDTTYGSMGFAGLQAGAELDDPLVEDVTTLPDGSLLSAHGAPDPNGTAGEGRRMSFVIKTRPDGSGPDPAFAGTGRLVLDLEPDRYGTEVRAVVARPDGRVVVAGVLAARDSTDTDRAFLLGLRADGSRDPSFAAGIATFHLDRGVWTDAVLQADGRLVVAGRRDGHVAVARFTTGGVADTTFSPDGTAGLYEEDGTSDPGDPSVALGPDGSVFTAATGGGPSTGLAIKLTPAGVPDATFAQDGLTTYSCSGVETQVGGIAVDRASRPLIALRSTSGSTDTVGAKRLRADGVQDSTYHGSCAVATLPTSQVQGIHLLPNGAALVVSWARGGSTRVQAFTPTGTEDPTFGSGIGRTDVNGLEPAASTVDAQGRLIIGGHRFGLEPSAYALRLIGDGPPVAAFTPPLVFARRAATFQPVGSSDPDGPLSRIAWDWDNDGSDDSVDTAQDGEAHTFPEPGRVTVGLRVTDSVGQVAQTTRTFDVLRPAPLVTTTSAADVTATGAKVLGTVDDQGFATEWWVEYGPTTAYGSRTASTATDGGGGAKAVAATLSGLPPDSDVHARVVARSDQGPVSGDDVRLHTARAAVSAAGLPPDVDVRVEPDTRPLTAGLPIRLVATGGPGLAYAWDLDHRAAEGFRPDPAQTGPVVEQTFSAADEHAVKLKGSTGERRRTYRVRLRVSAPNGASTEVSKVLVIVPGQPPNLDLNVVQQATAVHRPVAFQVDARDPDAAQGDAITQLRWNLDAGAAGDTGDDVVCAGGGGCTAADGAPLGAWLAEGAEGKAGVTVDFWARGLTAHGLQVPGRLGLLGGRQSAPLVLRAGTQTTEHHHQAPISELYDFATLVQQSSFNLDAGEATGASLAGGSARTRAVPKMAQWPPAHRRLLELLRDSRFLRHREIAVTAIDRTGQATTVQRPVRLTPAQPPALKAAFRNEEPGLPVRGGHRLGGRKVGVLPKDTGGDVVTYPITPETDVRFDVAGTSDPDGDVRYLTLETGPPAETECGFKPPPKVLAPRDPAPGEDVQRRINPAGILFDPSTAFGGAGPAGQPGRVGAISTRAPVVKGLKVGGQFQARAAQATATNAPALQSMLDGLVRDDLGAHVVHTCPGFAPRNVVPLGPSIVRSTRPASVDPDHAQGLDFGTGPLSFRFPESAVGQTWSVAVGAYDDSGLASIQRTDGFKVVAAKGDCQKLSGESIRIAGVAYGMSGGCVDIAGNRRVFFSRGPVSINGLTLRPKDGGILVRTDGSGGIAAVGGRPANLADADPEKLGGGTVEVVLDDKVVMTVANVTTGKALALLRGQAVSGVTTAKDFQGLPVVQQPTVRFGRAPSTGATPNCVDGPRSTGASCISFPAALPRTMGDGTGAAPQKLVVRGGFDAPETTTLETRRYASAAQRRIARAARAAQRRRTARIALSIPSTTRIDLDGTSIGPVSIEKGYLEYKGGGNFRANIGKAFLTLNDKYEIALDLELVEGKLQRVEGKVRAGAGIPIVPGTIVLKEVRFRVVTDPLEIAGGLTAETLTTPALEGKLDLLLKPNDPFLLRLDGSVSIKGGPELATAYFQIAGETVTFGGHLGVDFGPAAVNIDVRGGFSGDGFFLEGTGTGCIGICLKVKGLISSIAVAACGSIDLLVAEISAGVALRYKGGLKLFTGCDLDPYIPAGLRSFRQDGAPTTIPVAAGTEQIAFRAVVDPAQGVAPRITVTGPDGTVVRTPEHVGDYAFGAVGAAGLEPTGGTAKQPGALVDQDPVSGVTTVIVVRPAAGAWSVTADPDQPPLVAIEVAKGKHLPEDALEATVQPVRVQDGGDEVRIGKRTFAVAGSSAARAAQRKGRPVVPRQLAPRTPEAIDAPRQRGVVLDVPAGVTGKLTLLDVAADTSDVIGTIDLRTYAGKQVPIAFDPTLEPGRHVLRAFLTKPDGEPRGVYDVDDFTGPTVKVPAPPDAELVRTGDDGVAVRISPDDLDARDADTRFGVVASASDGQRLERVIDGSELKRVRGGTLQLHVGTFTPGATVKVAVQSLYGERLGRLSTDTIRLRR